MNGRRLDDGSRLTREESRIAFIIERDGEKAAVEWVRRTLRIYRQAVLDRGHFASTTGYRRRYVESCCDFKRWLRLARMPR